MGSLVALVIFAAIAVQVMKLVTAKKKKAGRTEPVWNMSEKAISKTEKPKPKRPLTANEQPMYFRLVEALPEHVVLAQVSFSALITSRDQRVRNTFDRKVADFVICDRTFRVMAVVELDDSSHKGREEKDRAREALLTDAGLRVLRYPRTPDIDQIRKDICPTPV